MDFVLPSPAVQLVLTWGVSSRRTWLNNGPTHHRKQPNAPSVRSTLTPPTFPLPPSSPSATASTRAPKPPPRHAPESERRPLPLRPALLALLLATLPLRAQQPAPETYTNPILFADYSDPDAIRVGNDYYLVASSFHFVPGIPILHSTDLVHWKSSTTP